MFSLYDEKFKARFVKSVAVTPNSNGCLLWLGSVSKNGYGCISFMGIKESVHRVSYEIHNKKRLKRGLMIRHICDNKLCVNPEHLIPGRALENTHDMIERGRDRFSANPRAGQLNPNAKLSEEDVLVIKGLIAEGKTNKEIAARMGVSHSMISRIKLKKSWNFDL